MPNRRPVLYRLIPGCGGTSREQLREHWGTGPGPVRSRTPSALRSSIHPDQLAGEQRFRADLVAYLDTLPVGELAELPSSRQQRLQLGVLLVALNERLPDAYKLLLPAGHPAAGEGWRGSL